MCQRATRTSPSRIGMAVVSSCRRSNKAHGPDLVEEVIHACQRKAQRGLVDDAPVADLLMHAADHDLGSKHRTRRDRCERLVHLLLRAQPPVKAGEVVIVNTGLLLSTEHP